MDDIVHNVRIYDTEIVCNCGYHQVTLFPWEANRLGKIHAQFNMQSTTTDLRTDFSEPNQD